MIEIRDVCKQFGDHVVLQHLTVSVADGDFISIVGSSGCGKSTFLNLLLGTSAVSKGAITLDGRPIATEPGPDRGIVFQQYSVFPHMTVLGNVMAAVGFGRRGLTAWLRGEAKAAARRKVDELLSQVGLSDSRQRYPHELSGGMQQRLAIAQALVTRPRILLLDEPFGALDPGIRKDMQALLRDLWQQYGLTVFMVTHDLREGFELATRVWVFDKPHRETQATSEQGATITYDLPATRGQHGLRRRFPTTSCGGKSSRATSR